LQSLSLNSLCVDMSVLHTNYGSVRHLLTVSEESALNKKKTIQKLGLDGKWALVFILVSSSLYVFFCFWLHVLDLS